MHRKIRFLSIFFVILIVFPNVVTPVHSWASRTHSWIADKAMDTIIDFIPELEENYNTLKDYAPVPDSWRASNDDEGSNHYFDWPNGPGRVDIAILSWSICLAKELGEDSPDYNFVAKVAGVLCHYIGDYWRKSED